MFSILADFDLLFQKQARLGNHRMFITHSTIPFLILVIFSILLGNLLIFACSLSYLSHIFIDTIDWGTNLLYTPKKLVGLKILIPKNENDEFSKILKNYNNPYSFFNFRYYKSKTILSLELFVFVLMIISIIYLALEFIYFITFYILAIFFHVFFHSRLKKLESH